MAREKIGCFPFEVEATQSDVWLNLVTGDRVQEAKLSPERAESKGRELIGGPMEPLGRALIEAAAKSRQMEQEAKEGSQ